jgi:hypothetical protein
MKKILIITTVILLIIGCKTGKIAKYKPLSSFKGDTIRFLQKSILDRKAYYIGKALNVFLSDLNIPIVNHTTTKIFSNRFITPGIGLQFYSYKEQSRRIKNKIDPIDIEITWVKPMSKAKCDSVLKKDNYARWATNAKEFYGKQIIGDLNLSKFENSKLHDEKLIDDKTKLAKYQPLKKFKGDTLSFIKKSILDRTEYYEGKKVSVLIKDLKIQLKDLVKGYVNNSENPKHQGMMIQIFTRFEKRYSPAEDLAITIVMKDIKEHQSNGKQQGDIDFYKGKIVKSVFLNNSIDINYFKNLKLPPASPSN